MRAAPRDGCREEAEPAGPLDDHGLAGLEPGLVKAVDHLGQGAVERRHGEIVERVRRAEHVVAGLEVIVVGEGAREVGRRVARRTAGSDAPRDAVVRVTGAAELAAPARIEVRVDDAVALTKGRAGCVRRHVCAEPRDPARHLVPHDGRAAPRRATVPAVEVRAADVGDGHAHQDPAGLDLGQGELARLEGLLDAGEDEGSSIHRLLLLRFP